MLALPLDFDSYRRAIVAAVALGTGLDPGQVIMLQPEAPNAPRPTVPYVGLRVLTVAVKTGFDAPVSVADDAGFPTGLVAYVGPREMNVSFECFGATHEQAYGVMAAWQASLDTPPVQQLLEASDLAVYTIGQVTDLSTLLLTAYEGRAQMDCSFGMTSRLTVDAGRIDTVDITGSVVQNLNAVDVTLTTTRGS